MKVTVEKERQNENNKIKQTFQIERTPITSPSQMSTEYQYEITILFQPPITNELNSA
jgi:hypothetical protein